MRFRLGCQEFLRFPDMAWLGRDGEGGALVGAGGGVARGWHGKEGANGVELAPSLPFTRA